nr:major pollen allergen Ole e 10-like [Coffea arabica]
MARTNQLSFVLGFLLCSVVFTNTEARVQKFWCVLRRGIPDSQVQQFLDSACSQLDCRPINPGGACYDPNTYANHGSYALDLYYVVRGQCPGIGIFTDNNPSHGNCIFP